MKYEFKDRQILKALLTIGFTEDEIDQTIDLQMKNGYYFVTFKKVSDDGSFSSITVEVSKSSIFKSSDRPVNGWYPFPKCRPKNTDLFLVTTREPNGEKEIIQFGFWDCDEGDWTTPFRGEVIAFRKLPDPYRKMGTAGD